MPPRRLGVNIDHVATLRQARRSPYPDPVTAAVMAELAGAAQITCPATRARPKTAAIGAPSSTSCEGCPLGHFGATAGLASCAACPAGHFQDTAGSTSCSLCAAMTARSISCGARF